MKIIWWVVLGVLTMLNILVIIGGGFTDIPIFTSIWSFVTITLWTITIKNRNNNIIKWIDYPHEESDETSCFKNTSLNLSDTFSVTNLNHDEYH